MSTTTQVSAYISEETKAEIEAYVKRRGVKKAYLIEEALQHHLQALREIPEDLVIPSRLVLTRQAMTEIAERMSREGEPTEGLKALLRE
ncbi:MAG: ribbon-helix-helix protein, CopG family [Sedimenticolaceae bacterium]